MSADTHLVVVRHKVRGEALPEVGSQVLIVVAVGLREDDLRGGGTGRGPQP